MQVFLTIGFIAVGLVQMFATFAGLGHLLGSTFLAVIIAMFFGGLPLVGSILGIYGAVNVWGWEIWQAALLFFWFVPVVIIASFSK